MILKNTGEPDRCGRATYSQLPTLLPDQLAMLNEVHGTLVHGIVCLVAKPVFITLKPDKQGEKMCLK